MSDPPRAHGPDRLERGTGGELVLACPTAKSWTARKAGSRTSPEHPGTAVEWGGRLFEVLSAEPTADGGMRYGLALWPEGHAIRRYERYDAASEEARDREQRRRRAGMGWRKTSILLAPFAGLLPGDVQKNMEWEFGAPALAMTISSALPLFVVGFLGLFASMAGVFRGTLDLPAWLAPPMPVALYLFAESWLRLASAVAAGEPMGSFPVVAVYDALHGSRRRRARAEIARDDDRDGRDRYRMLEPALALLSPAEQERLEKRFGFEPLRWGKITATLVLAVSGANTLVSFPTDETNRVAVEWPWLLPSFYLVGEQLYRLARLRAGRPAGSVLGVIVRPFAKSLLPSGPTSNRKIET